MGSSIMARWNEGIQQRRRPSQMNPSQINLDQIQDTSNTIDSTATGQVSPNNTQSQSVPPPFSGDAAASTFITQNDVAKLWNLVKNIVGLLVPVATIIWYAAYIYFNVGNLQKDVNEIKDKTQVLTETNITQDLQLNTLELSVTNVKAQVDSQMQKSGDSLAPNKRMQSTR